MLMNNRFLFLFSALFLAGILPDTLRADEQSQATETRLRQALRENIVQLRDAQNQVVTLQAAQTQSDKEKADLQAKVEALTAQVARLGDQATADKAAAEKAIADLTQGTESLVTQMVDTLTVQINYLGKPETERNASTELDKAVAGLKTQNPALTKALDQYGTDIRIWASGYNQYVQLHNQTEAARAKLAGQVIVLQRTVSDREAKNIALFNVGIEILTRYEKFSLGDALAAKEPFAGMTRVKLQNLVQDYKDKLLNQTVVSGQPPSSPDSREPSTNSDLPKQTGLAADTGKKP